MFAKIKSGNHFKGAIDYVMDTYDNGKHSHIIAHSDGILTLDNRTIASCFEAYAKRGNNNIPEPVMHISLSFSKYDDARLTDELMSQIVKDYMRDMGYDGVEYIICRHHDKEHPHCHLLFCAVNNKGKAVSRSNERLRNKNVCKKLTLKYGLYMSSGKEGVHRDRLRGIDKAKYDLYDTIITIKKKSQDWKEFDDMLKANGITMKFHYNNTNGKIMGVTFSDGKFSFSGRQIDRSLTLPKLMEEFGDFREIVHESIHICYDRYQQQLARLNCGNTDHGYYFTMLRLFPYWDKIFPDGLPKSFKTPYPSVPKLLSNPRNSCLESDIVHTKDGKSDYVGLITLLVLLMEPYQPQMALAGAGGGSTGGGMPWRDLDNDDDRWKYRFAVDPSVYPRYIKPRYMKSKPIVSHSARKR